MTYDYPEGDQPLLLGLSELPEQPACERLEMV